MVPTDNCTPERDLWGNISLESLDSTTTTTTSSSSSTLIGEMDDKTPEKYPFKKFPSQESLESTTSTLMGEANDKTSEESFLKKLFSPRGRVSKATLIDSGFEQFTFKPDNNFRFGNTTLVNEKGEEVYKINTESSGLLKETITIHTPSGGVCFFCLLTAPLSHRLPGAAR